MSETITTPEVDKKTCEHVNIETRIGFCYDELRCVDCGAYMGEPVDNAPLI
jgi:hypothetical protein